MPRILSICTYAPSVCLKHDRCHVEHWHVINEWLMICGLDWFDNFHYVWWRWEDAAYRVISWFGWKKGGSKSQRSVALASSVGSEFGRCRWTQLVMAQAFRSWFMHFVWNHIGLACICSHEHNDQSWLWNSMWSRLPILAKFCACCSSIQILTKTGESHMRPQTCKDMQLCI